MLQKLQQQKERIKITIGFNVLTFFLTETENHYKKVIYLYME